MYLAIHTVTLKVNRTQYVVVYQNASLLVLTLDKGIYHINAAGFDVLRLPCAGHACQML